MVSIIKQHNDRGHEKSTGGDLSDDDVRRKRSTWRMTVQPKYAEPYKPVKRCEETDESTPINSTDRDKPLTLLNINMYTLSLTVLCQIIYLGYDFLRFVFR